MKILFICGCLESGKDGVGDYTRRLSAELIRRGISVGILALNDYYIDDLDTTSQVIENINIPCYRISINFSKKKRVKLAREWIEFNNPEWLSLQFVIYSFNPKGLPFGLGKELKDIGGTRKWHIMFHELWLGLRNNDSFKYKIIGIMQKLIVKAIQNSINIKVVHTHTQLYLHELTKFSFKAKYLPIFSNIPVIKGKNKNSFSSFNKISFIIFGTIHPGAPIKQFVKELSSYFTTKKELKVSLIVVGRSGDEQFKWIKEFELFGIEVLVLGELDPSEISHVLQNATYGITTNPIFSVEKSGTVAAMREHSLPILIVCENTRPRDNINLDFFSDLEQYKVGHFSKFMLKKSVKPTIKGITEISSQLLNDLGLN